MVYFDVKPLGDLLKEFFEQHRGSDYLDEITVINSWPKVVGPFIASTYPSRMECCLCVSTATRFAMNSITPSPC